jgi:nuclear-control-of-ATPase protein 2
MDNEETRGDASYEHELEWLLLSKATTQAYGQVLNTILEQTIPLEDDIWYWDDVLSSYRFAGLYSIQTSPIRLWNWSQEIYHDVRSRGGHLADGWSQFYALVKDSVQQRSIANIQRRVVSPLALVRNEGRRKRAALRRVRLVNANALGVLLGEGLSNDRFVVVLRRDRLGTDNYQHRRRRHTNTRTVGRARQQSSLEERSFQDYRAHGCRCPER